jgi:hypothetical protein
MDKLLSAVLGVAALPLVQVLQQNPIGGAQLIALVGICVWGARGRQGPPAP